MSTPIRRERQPSQSLNRVSNLATKPPARRSKKAPHRKQQPFAVDSFEAMPRSALGVQKDWRPQNGIDRFRPISVAGGGAGGGRGGGYGDSPAVDAKKSPGIISPRQADEAVKKTLAERPEKTIELLRKVGVDSKEEFFEFLKAVIDKKSGKTLDSTIEGLGKTSDGLKVVEKLAEAYRREKQGDHGGAVAALAEAVANGYQVLPEATRNAIIERVAQSLANTRLAPLVDVLKQVKTPDAMKAVAALLKGNASDFIDGMKGVAKSISKDEKLMKRLALALLKLLPDKVKKKLIAKMAGRKIPLVGTVVVGIWDFVNIANNPKDWKNWAGLVSTGAGAFPGAGTAASVAIDIAILVGEVADLIGDLSKATGVASPTRRDAFVDVPPPVENRDRFLA